MAPNLETSYLPLILIFCRGAAPNCLNNRTISWWPQNFIRILQSLECCGRKRSFPWDSHRWPTKLFTHNRLIILLASKQHKEWELRSCRLLFLSQKMHALDFVKMLKFLLLFGSSWALYNESCNALDLSKVCEDECNTGKNLKQGNV